MLKLYETERLELRILDTSYTEDILEFMEANKETFERWDATRPKDFYTYNYQYRFLTAEYNLYNEGKTMRYWLFLKHTSTIIGSVSFSHINDSKRHCSIGYKLAEEYQGLGYAMEAASFILPLVVEEFDIKRIEADIMPNNYASQKLAERLGFHYECLAVKSHEILGKLEDHLRYSYVR